jgi:hypothetical protein
VRLATVRFSTTPRKPGEQPVDENEFASSEVVSAINDYLESAGAILELTGTIYHVFDATVAEAFSPRLRSTLGGNARR